MNLRGYYVSTENDWESDLMRNVNSINPNLLRLIPIKHDLITILAENPSRRKRSQHLGREAGISVIWGVLYFREFD